MHPQVWKVSGHFDLFYDLFVDCRTCKARFRADQVKDSQCPQQAEQAAGRAQRVRTDRAARVQPDVQDERRRAHRRRRPRPSCAPRRPRASSSTSRTSCRQHARASSRSASRRSARVFRNEITPRNFTFRSREFEQMEIEFFCHPEHVARSGTSTGATAGYQWYTRPRPGQRPAAAARPHDGGTEPLLVRHGRHRIRLPVPRRRASSASWRAWPIAATSTCAATWKASSCARATSSSSRLDADGQRRSIAAAART